MRLLGSVSERDYHHPGDQITILYDPLRPGRARAEFRDPDEGFALRLLVAIIFVAVICGLSAVASAGR